MSDTLLQLGLFSAKTFIILVFIIVILLVFFALIAKAKQKHEGKLTIKNLNKKYAEYTETLLTETLSKKDFKHYLKNKKAAEKTALKHPDKVKRVYVLHFNGDIRASAVPALSEEVNAILAVATPQDEVVVKLESAGGMVHAYGLAAAQLMRIRKCQIPLTVTVDKVAASGGYMMACIANRILASPFAIIGSIGVIVQLPNFHRLLKEKNIDFEQLTAGEYKRTLTLFGENTPEGRNKLKEEIEEIHHLFKDFIVANRPDININQVATGEHWLGTQALTLKLVDEIKTSDEYLLELSKKSDVYEVCYETKKSFLSKLLGPKEQSLLASVPLKH